jgi:hypothetical protein
VSIFKTNQQLAEEVTHNPATQVGIVALLDAKDREREKAVELAAFEGMGYLRVWVEAAAMKGVIDLTGDVAVARKVLGTLPVTADGVIVVEPSEVWWWDGNVLLGGGGGMKMELAFADPNEDDRFFSPNAGIGACYSTREAAEAARKEPPHAQ